MNAKERMLKYLDYKGISQYDFSKKTGLSNGFLKSGIGISSENLELIMGIYLDLNLLWLVSGQGNMLVSENNAIETNKGFGEEVVQKETPQAKLPKLERPLLRSFQCDVDAYPNFQFLINAGNTKHVSVPVVDDHDFCIVAKGNSMIHPEQPQRSIFNNDIVVCKLWKSTSHIRWGEVYAILTQDGVAVKKIVKSELDDHIKCVSYNQTNGFYSYDLPNSEVLDQALVVGKVSGWDFQL